MRAAFLGTPEAAIPSLAALADAAEIGAVITQPDRPRGRSRQERPPPVKEWAETAGLHVVQPARSSEIAPVLQHLGPFDVAVVVAFGMLIRPEALRVPRTGFLNVHFSLLPRWRGAAPVQRSMLAGDERSGVTIMQLDEGLDTGPTEASTTTAIGHDETGGELTTRLAHIGAALLVGTVPLHLAKLVYPLPQPTDGATSAPKLGPDDRIARFDVDTAVLRRQIMALAPAPGTTATLDGKPFKLLRAGDVRDGPSATPGTLDVEGGRLWCAAGNGWLELTEVQPAGKRRMAAADWIRGRGGQPGRLE